MKLKKPIFLLSLVVFASQSALPNKISAGKIQPVKSIKEGAYSLSALKGKFASWGVDPTNAASINLAPAWRKFNKKSEVVVAVIDTGIEQKHEFLKGNVIGSKLRFDAKDYGLDFSSRSVSNTPSDTHGHGTHVSGIIRSVYPEVKILSLKYYSPKASGTANLEATIKALRYAVERNVDVINYSGGGPESSKEELAILKEAERKGILIIAAAGNERSNIDKKKNAYYPASYGLSNIITVAAHKESNELISASNWGNKSVDIAAPGEKIKSSIPGNAAGYMTGTSQATAFVTGVAALIKSNYPQFNSVHVKNIILSSSKKVKELKEKVLGSAKLDAGQALEKAAQVYARLFKNKPTTPQKLKTNTVRKRDLAHH